MIGTTLAHYRITAALGAGGMGEVWRATDEKLGREVALKVLPAEMAASPQRLDRFRREARALASLNHPNIAHLYGLETVESGTGPDSSPEPKASSPPTQIPRRGADTPLARDDNEGRVRENSKLETQDSKPHVPSGTETGMGTGPVTFLVMELVEGESLDRLIPEGGMPVGQLLEIATALTEALAAAHDKGIVHRDLKPANVMVTNDGRVKVLDFGLAKMSVEQPEEPLGSEMETDLHTREGVVMGTMPYMSPEQVAGRAVDRRTDIFSLGVVLYEMATGQRPFGATSTAELTSAILRDAPVAPGLLRKNLPPQLGTVISGCLEKEPAARFQSMGEVQCALQAFPGKQTVPRRGPRSRTHALTIAGGVSILLAVASFLLVRFGFFEPARRAEQASRAPEISSIAVLPLDNYSGDPSQDYFAEGMTDALTSDLARISQLRVISRGSAMQFGSDPRPSTPEIAKALDVDAIVEGSVNRSGERVLITVQLIDARADRHLWADSFERSSQDVFALQSDLASAIAREINVQLTPAERSQLRSAQSVDPEAYDAYLKGRYFFNRPSDENLKKAIDRFEDALALSPDFVPALSGLSDAYLWAGYNEGFITASEARPRAKAAAERAIQLDDRSAEAHTSLAVFKLFYEYDWEGCEVEFRRAFELNPNYAFAHDQFALGLAFTGRYEESIAESALAAELDPLNPQIFIDSIFALAWQGDYRGAKEQARRAEDLDPTYFFPEMSYGWINIQAGEVADAIPHLQKSKTMGAPAFVSAWLAYAYGASGDRESALAETEDLKKMSLNGVVTPFDNALVALGLGDYPRAVSLLEQAYALDSQWLGWLKNDRAFDPLRNDPRFATLLKRLNFEE